MNRLISAAAIAAFLLPAAAHAASEVPRPPAVLSPDLTAPWIMQFKPGAKLPALTYGGATRRTLFAPPIGQPQASLQPTLIRIPGASTTAPDTRRYPINPEFLPQTVAYATDEKPGTIIIDTPSRHLYLVLEGGLAIRYGVGVGRPGFEWAGVHKVTRKAEWPEWTPPPEMLERKPDLPRHMDGGPDNPLGARALYLGSTLYRIHGSNEPWTIGHAVSSGCIRMRNDDIVDLYSRVPVGTRVIVI